MFEIATEGILLEEKDPINLNRFRILDRPISLVNN